MIEFKLPSLGADMDQGTLLEWKIKPGDTVQRGQVVAVVDTSKAAVEVESWQEGTVQTLLVQPDTVVPVGTAMALFLEPGESPETAMAAPVAEVKAEAPQPAPTLPTPVAPALAPSIAAGERRRVSPAARKRAAELKLNPDAIVAGSGPDGAVTVEDVERAAKAAPVDRAAEMRKTIAAAMSRAKREIPHYYLAETVPLRRATEWLARENEKRPMARRVLMAAVMLKAVAVTLKRFPDFNGFYRDGAFQPSPAVHVGVAISLRQGGLIAPALHDPDAKGLEPLMAELADLITRARAGSLRSSELSDPTVTLTNLGEQGVESVFGVIYPPQVALVGFGRVAPRPLVQEDGQVRAVPAVQASLSADHRVSDGHRGAQFLAALAEQLQQPETL